MKSTRRRTVATVFATAVIAVGSVGVAAAAGADLDTSKWDSSTDTSKWDSTVDTSKWDFAPRTSKWD